MGFFGRFVYSDGRWHGEAPIGPYLSVDVHDSDIATVEYQCPGISGRFYLGYEPRHYFEDPAASEPIDGVAAAEGFVLWADQVLGVRVNAREVKRLLASPKGRDPKDDFVEKTVRRLLAVVRLAAPDGLPPG